MASLPINAETELRARFVKSELTFLKSNHRFADAMLVTKTAFHFERLCKLGEELLLADRKVNSSAQQFRAQLKTTCD